MTSEDITVVAGIPIPSTSPIFLTVVGLHVLVGLVCVVAGAVAMSSPKRGGRHPTFGTIYYWGLVVMFVSAAGLSVVRWAEDYHLFILGLLALIAASLGRAARRHPRPPETSARSTLAPAHRSCSMSAIVDASTKSGASRALSRPAMRLAWVDQARSA